jgi:bifunctional non-homologous end joining protein LigD
VQAVKEKQPAELQAILDQLADARAKTTVEVEGDKLPVTNLDKVFWPGTSDHPPLTKRDYMMYLAKVSPWLLPHMKDRPITFVRFPNGIEGGKFYQKHWEKGLPGFVQTLQLFAEHAAKDQEYIVCNNLPTLLWLAQIADLELHTWQSRIEAGPDALNLPKTFGGSLENLEASLLNYPDFLLFDLDPYLYSGKEKRGDEPELHMKGFKKTVELAKWVKEILDSLKVDSFVKTTGKTGIHMYVPIVRDFTFDEIRALSREIGQIILKQHPNDVTMSWAVVKRTGKVFLDHNMNARGKTLASIFSPRVSPEAAVSFPLSWDEIDDVYPTDFTMHNVPELLQKDGDLWADILDRKNDLRQLLSREPGLQQQRKKRSR